MATKRQERATEIMMANPAIRPAKALIAAGYSEKNVGKNMAKILGSDGMVSLQDVYQYELVRKGVTPKLLAKKIKDGIKGKDPKTSVLAYVESAKKDLSISQESPDVAVQINLEGDLKDYGT